MTSSVRRRVLNLIAAHLRDELVPDVARSVELDLRGFAQVGTAGCPVLFITTTETSTGETEHLPYAHVREAMSFAIIGYVASPTGQIDGVMQAREEFLAQTMQALYRKTDDVEVLLKALIDDAVANDGNGAVDIKHVAPPDTDGGFTPPFGIFRVPCEALLHYQRDQF